MVNTKITMYSKVKIQFIRHNIHKCEQTATKFSTHKPFHEHNRGLIDYATLSGQKVMILFSVLLYT